MTCSLVESKVISICVCRPKDMDPTHLVFVKWKDGFVYPAKFVRNVDATKYKVSIIRHM